MGCCLSSALPIEIVTTTATVSTTALDTPKDPTPDKKRLGFFFLSPTPDKTKHSTGRTAEINPAVAKACKPMATPARRLLPTWSFVSPPAKPSYNEDERA